jgi:hypothetical protein
VNGIFFNAMNEVGITLPPDLPAGPPMFRFSEDGQLSTLLAGAGLAETRVRACSFIHSLVSSEELWKGILGGTVRTSIGIRLQTKIVQDRIRAAFDRLAQPYVRHDGMRVPVAFKIGSGQRPSS